MSNRHSERKRKRVEVTSVQRVNSSEFQGTDKNEKGGQGHLRPKGCVCEPKPPPHGTNQCAVVPNSTNLSSQSKSPIVVSSPLSVSAARQSPNTQPDHTLEECGCCGGQRPHRLPVKRKVTPEGGHGQTGQQRLGGSPTPQAARCIMPLASVGRPLGSAGQRAG